MWVALLVDGCGGGGDRGSGQGGSVGDEKDHKVGGQGSRKGGGRVVLIFDSLLISVHVNLTIILLPMSDYCILVRCPNLTVITGVIVLQ